MPLRDLWPAWRDAWILHRGRRSRSSSTSRSGISTHAPEPDRVDDAHTRLGAYLRQRGEADPYLGIHQRLDRDTSGVFLFTRSASEANGAIAAQFEGRKVEKIYVAGVTGLAEREREGVLRHRLVPDERGGMRALPAAARAGAGGGDALARARAPRRSRAARAVPRDGPHAPAPRAARGASAPRSPGRLVYGGAPAPRLLLHAAEPALRHPADGAPHHLARAGAAGLRGGGSQAPTAPACDCGRRDRRARSAPPPRTATASPAGGGTTRVSPGQRRPATACPGVDVDVYGEHLVVSLSSDEAERRARERCSTRRPRLGAARRLRQGPAQARQRASSTRDREEFAPREAVRGASAPESFTVRELRPAVRGPPRRRPLDRDLPRPAREPPARARARAGRARAQPVRVHRRVHGRPRWPAARARR